MDNPLAPCVIVTLCRNCIPDGSRLPRQWDQDGVHVLVRINPCSGKTEMTYLFRALQQEATGHCVVTCPNGDCRLSQGNQRARLRVETTRRLLTEIGMDKELIQIMECPKDLSAEEFENRVRTMVSRVALHSNGVESEALSS